jgi:DNA-binding MarR family transcriptional regulator
MEKLFFVEINYLDNDDHCFASNGYFAEFFNLTKGRVSQIITSLVKKGVLNTQNIRRKDSPEIERRVLSLTSKGKALYNGQVPLENYRGGIEYAEDRDRVNNNISKDLYTLPEEVVVETKKEYNLKNKDLIEYYNELPNVQKHKIPKSGKISKVLERIDRYLINLKAGTFSKKIKSQQTYNKKWHTLKKLDILMAKKFNILPQMPVLIIEKMGPHFAIGDTCFSWEEDKPVYNPDGKEIIARDNDVSILRKTDMDKAYTNKHTDITLPYEELAYITAVTESGERFDILRDGRFVVTGTEEFNEPLEELDNMK